MDKYYNTFLNMLIIREEFKIHLDNGIVFPSHPIDSSIYYIDYISLCLLIHTLYILYAEKNSN